MHTKRPASQPIVLVVKVRGKNRDAFVRRYFPDAVPGGFFLRTGSCPVPPLGAWVCFRFRLENDCDIFSGIARVAWVRRGDGAGVALRFLRLLPGSDQVHGEMLVMAQRLRRQQREFADAPTRPVHRIVPPVRLVPRH